MKYLLDTHAFLWAISSPENLSPVAAEIIEDPQNIIFLSAVSGWEIAIKSSIGKLSLPEPAEKFVFTQMKIAGISELPISLEHALTSSKLPKIHSDPFDRMLVSQSISENMPLISCDRYIKKYKLRIVW